MDLRQLADVLHREKCSCVVWNRETLTLCHQRGVKDLYTILSESPDLLRDASIADKIIGKGAAALMILGGVRAVYADIISEPALELFKNAGITVQYEKAVPNIINRAGTGVCPVESLCSDCTTAEDCLPLISKFIENINK
ncbi:MAG: DUF1893 domain-containing protein [Muribaculaceae bacterium]|nr:DUF1893 domain-containing protein [Muribaculaceae bacterium]